MRNIAQRKYWVAIALFLLGIGGIAELVVDNGRELFNWAFIGSGAVLLLLILAVKIRQPIVLRFSSFAGRAVLGFAYLIGGIGYLNPPWESLAFLIAGAFCVSFSEILNESKGPAEDLEGEAKGTNFLVKWELINWICGVGGGSGRNNRNGF